MEASLDTPPHPLGLIDNPEWDQSRARRADLYLAERARRYPKRQPTAAEVFLTCLRGFWT